MSSTSSFAEGATSEAAPIVRAARTAGIVVALLAAAFLALNKDSVSDRPQALATEAEAAELAVATGDFVADIAHDSRVVRATGGYVPTVGTVITAQVDSLATDEIDGWIGDLLANQPSLVGSLAEGEQVILLLDVAQPHRVSRLIAVDPTDLATSGSVNRREAPATSTMPAVVSFVEEGEG